MSVMMQAQSLCFCTVLCICFLMEIIWLSSSECFGYVLGSWTSMISFAGSGRTEKLFGDLMLVLLFDAFDLNLSYFLIALILLSDNSFVSKEGIGTRGKHLEAENFIYSSLKDNLELDTVAYNTFIKAMLEAGKLQFASSIFDRMNSSGVAPSIETFNTMISVYGQDQKLDRAVEMFNKASSFDVPLDEKTYMNLIGYYGKAELLILGARFRCNKLHRRRCPTTVAAAVVGWVIDRAERRTQHWRSQRWKLLCERSRHALPPSLVRVAHAPTSGETHSPPSPQTRPPEHIYLSIYDRWSLLCLFQGLVTTRLAFRYEMSEEKSIPLGVPNDLPNIGSTSWLDGQNYLQWNQYILRILKGRSKLDHIDEGGPGPDDTHFSIWEKEDSLIMT
ncbi:hypothetical protein V8G54_003159 [Vigna mungo]|uniref:Pentatricopeptide repeat-containing protein n=1 Tax=Vigna mungo TaxID=3915 RepID=A0AAQ3P9Z7_VIGMU